MVQWDEGGVKVDELKEKGEVVVEMRVVEVWEVVEVLEVEVMVVKLGVVVVQMVEVMVLTVEAGMEEVFRMIAVSC